MSDSPRQVEFQGESFWFQEGEDGTGALVHVGDCDENGDPLRFEDSYAHVFGDGTIRRHHEVIGHKSDLLPVEG